ncbi:MAG: hypothetical protein WBA51_04600 [Erythrobacter sp.]
MRAFLIPFAAFALIGANDKAEIEAQGPDVPVPVDGANHDARVDCQGRLTSTGDQNPPVAVSNKALFQRKPATPEKPLAIYAVERRENGCAVMVMMGDINDVRPLPETDEQGYRLLPAEQAQSGD